MNKQFFLRMKAYAMFLLVIGIIGATVMAFTITTNGSEYNAEANPTGISVTIASLFGSIALYQIMKGIALIGLKNYETEKIPEHDKPDNRPMIMNEYTETNDSYTEEDEYHM